MGEISNLGRHYLRPYLIDGLSASGENPPSKAEGRAVFDKIDDRIEQVAEFASAGIRTRLAPVDTWATSNITLSGEQTIAGVETSASSVVVTGQTNPAQNGIYVTASGAWTRRSDANTAAELFGAAVLVGDGNSAGTTLYCSIAADATLGTDPCWWVIIGNDESSAAVKIEVENARGGEDSLADRLAAIAASTLPVASPEETYRAAVANKVVAPNAYGIALDARVPMVMAVDPVVISGRLIVPTVLSFDLRVVDGYWLDTGQPMGDRAINNPAVVVKVSAGRIDMYFQSSSDPAVYINWVLRNTVAPARNADIWSTRGVWEAARSADGSFVQGMQIMADPSELETAIKFAGKADFVGGNLHGNEELTSFRMHLDGVEVDHTIVATYEPRLIEFFQATDMFEPGTTSETVWSPKGPHIMECWKRWSFASHNGGVRLVLGHYIEHVVDGFTVDFAYFGMVPIERVSSDDGATQITDTAARDPKFVTEDVSETGHTEISTSTRSIAIWGSRYRATCTPTRGWTDPSRRMRVSNASAYNKIYPSYWIGSTTDDGSPWDVETTIDLHIRD